MLLIAHLTLRLLNMRYVVDIDGTICEHFNGPNFGSGQVYYDRIEKINKLYDEGHEIVYMTARGMGTKNNPEGNFDEESMNRARQKYGRLTETQLEEWIHVNDSEHLYFPFVQLRKRICLILSLQWIR